MGRVGSPSPGDTLEADQKFMTQETTPGQRGRSLYAGRSQGGSLSSTASWRLCVWHQGLGAMR